MINNSFFNAAVSKNLQSVMNAFHQPNDNSPMQLVPYDQNKEILFQSSTSLELNNQLEGLEFIPQGQDTLNRIRECLSVIIDSIEQDPSVVSKLAKQWGKLTFIEKFIGGMIVSVPVVAVGLFTGAGLLLTASGFNIVIYTSGGFLLDDHYQHSKNLSDNIKKGILELADCFMYLILILRQTCMKLSAEVARLENKNMEFTHQINALNSDIKTLQTNIAHSKMIQGFLQQQKEDIEKDLKKIDYEVQSNSTLHQQTLKKLEGIQTDLAKNKQEFYGLLKELDTKRAESFSQRSKLKEDLHKIQSTVDFLIDKNKDSKPFKDSFKEEYPAITSSKDTLKELQDTISSSQNQFQRAQQKLQETLLEQEQMMHEQDFLFTELQELDAYLDDNTNDTKILTSIGLFQGNSCATKSSKEEKRTSATIL